MQNGALITQFPGVTWFVDFTIPGISEILVARIHYAQRSIGALICPTTGGKFVSPANPLAIQMLGHFLSVEIQASGAIAFVPVLGLDSHS
jgi:hypothetical protein